VLLWYQCSRWAVERLLPKITQHFTTNKQMTLASSLWNTILLIKRQIEITLQKNLRQVRAVINSSHACIHYVNMWDEAGDMTGLSASLSSSAFYLQHRHASFRRHTDTLQRPWGTRRISGSLLWSWWLFYSKSADYPIPR